MITDVPDSLSGADWVEKVDMSPNKSGRVRPFKLDVSDVWEFFAWERDSGVAYQKDATGSQLPNHLNAVPEVILAFSDDNLWIGRQRICVSRGDKD